jgi:glycerol uptake facilitator-like aquaporin/uncharacterized protein YuzE
VPIPANKQSLNLLRRAIAEAVGTAFLLAAVVGSGIMAERLAGGNQGLALLANTIATGAALVALILTFGQISGAHFNPAVTLADASQGGISWRDVPAYIGAQITGAFAGVAAANIMFGLPVYFASHHARAGWRQVFSEFVATFGLLAVIWGCSRLRSNAIAFAVAAYIMAAYWFTASTSFANPAVTLARSASDTFAGVRPVNTPGFIVAQLLGAAAATGLFRWLIPKLPERAESVVLPHDEKKLLEKRGQRWFGLEWLPKISSEAVAVPTVTTAKMKTAGPLWPGFHHVWPCKRSCIDRNTGLSKCCFRIRFEDGSRWSEGNRTMKVTYDPEVDLVRIVFNNKTIEESETIKPGVILDYDKDENVVGMEILHASKQIEDPRSMEYTIAG